MTPPKGGPPITRGETTFVPTRRHRPGSRKGDATEGVGRDLAKVAEIAREAAEDGMARRQQRMLNKAIKDKASKAGVGLGVAMSDMRVERMSEHTDQTQRWWVRRHDYDLNETFGSEVTATNEQINKLSSISSGAFENWLWPQIQLADGRLIEDANRKRRAAGLPMLEVPSMNDPEWANSLYNPRPVLSEAERRELLEKWAIRPSQLQPVARGRDEGGLSDGNRVQVKPSPGELFKLITDA